MEHWQLGVQDRVEAMHWGYMVGWVPSHQVPQILVLEGHWGCRLVGQGILELGEWAGRVHLAEVDNQGYLGPQQVEGRQEVN